MRLPGFIVCLRMWSTCYHYAGEQRRAKEAVEETLAKVDEKRDVFSKKSEQLRSAVLTNQDGDDLVLEDFDGFNASPMKQQKQLHRPPLHQLAMGKQSVGAGAAAALAAEAVDAAAAADLAMEAARTAKLAAKASEVGLCRLNQVDP
jgi:hypothetical protein